jgi:anaerobic selenocysteine-containing dehydrogenase
VARALQTRELTVVVDSFLTDTAMEAHLVLPTTTMLEDDDLVGAYGHHFIANVQPVVPPPPGVRTDLAIVQELARRVGLGGDLLEPVRRWKERILAPATERGVSLEALEKGAQRNPLATKILFENRKFETPSGRVNLVHGVDPEPPRPTVERPLLLMALSTEKAQGSQWPSRTQQGPADVTVHPEAARGVPDGAVATIESELGSLQVRVRHDAKQRRDVALMAKGGWLSAGRCANALVPPRMTDDGGGAAYYDTPVRLVPLPEPG